LVVAALGVRAAMRGLLGLTVFLALYLPRVVVLAVLTLILMARQVGLVVVQIIL
jgi:hypothetical protein